MYGLIAVILVFVTIGLKWLTMYRIRALSAELVSATTNATHARDRLQIALKEVGELERKIHVAGRNNEVGERHSVQMEKEIRDLRIQIEEESELVRQKMEITEELRKKSGPRY